MSSTETDLAKEPYAEPSEVLTKTSPEAAETESETKLSVEKSVTEKERSSSALTEPDTSPLSDSASSPTTPLNKEDEPESLFRPPTSSQKDESPERSNRPKSSSSAEVVFTTKRKRKTKAPVGQDAHDVTFTVSIALAIPSEEDSCMPDIKDLMKRKKRVFEAPRAQSYYHLEYYLLPEDEEPIKTDLVTYGIAAKIYMERHDPRVLKTWQDGDVTWVAWTQSHCVTVTKDVLLQLYNHKLELRIWDHKDKCSTRARFDRPKAFRIPQPKPGEDPEELGGVRSQVFKMTRNFSCMQPKKSCAIRPLPSHITFPPSSRAARRKEEPEDVGKDAPPVDKKAIPQDGAMSPRSPRGQSPTPHTLLAVRETSETFSSGQDARTFSRLGRLAGIDSSKKSSRSDAPRSKQPGRGKSRERSSDRSQRQRSPKSREESSRPRAVSPQAVVKSPADSEYSMGSEKQPSDEKSPNKSPHRRNRLEGVSASDLERMKKHGIATIPVRMAVLFAGSRNLTSRLDEPVAGVEDGFVSVSLDSPLMSEPQRKELNPLIFKIHSATNLPNTPLDYQELQSRCNPVYCKYKLYKMAEHRSSGQLQAPSIYWDDINVCLTGVLEPSEFRQFLNGPPLEVEVHDRDRKPTANKMKPTLFGDDLEDEKINNVGTVTSRRTVHNAFQGRDKPWDPYGVAKVDLSELLLGNRFLYLKVPIHMSPTPDVLGLQTAPGAKVVGVDGAVDGPVSQPLPVGHYIESNSMLKITVELAYPLASLEDIAAKKAVPSTFECPFGRLIFRFEYRNTELLQRLQAVVSSINARALGLDDMPQHVIQAALSTYKVTKEQQQSRDLNIITGFHVLDEVRHLIVLEGLRDRGINSIWESLPQPENEDVTVLYNSDYTFADRMYGALDVDLCRIKLHEPLHTIVEQPLLYVRDMVPKLCFKSLVKLKELVKVSSIKEVIRNDLLPSAEMVVSMSKEFGVPLTAADMQVLSPSPVRIDSLNDFLSPVVTAPPAPCLASREWTPIDNYNTTYMERVMERQTTGCKHNYIQENIKEVELASNINQHSRPAVEKVRADVDVAHNYSSQALNSTQLAKEKLRQQLVEKDPDTRYTYCHDFLNSMTVVPVNVEEMRRKAAEEDKANWKTSEGWVYPGVKTAAECNMNPKQPDPARLDQLRTQWQENYFHANVLEPTLNRDKYPWQYRQHDLELYRKPLPNFGLKDPLSIHYGGDRLEAEQQAALKADHEKWKSKIIVDNPVQTFHRCLAETEQTERGPRASNDIEKLRGMLKDAPAKRSLRRPGFVLEDVPALGVVGYPSVDTATRAAGGSLAPAIPPNAQENHAAFNPGPFTNLSWTREENKIPTFNYQHQKFQTAKGQEFSLIHTNHTYRHKRSIPGLTEEELCALYGPQFSITSLDWKGAPLPPIEDSLNNNSNVVLKQTEVETAGS